MKPQIPATIPGLVSVIVPCYNHARFLPDCVESIRAQSYSHWECLIVNDGSSDNTAEVAASLAKEEQRIRVVSQENRGLAGARNRGLSESRGQYIQFLDADDSLAPTKLELQVHALESALGRGLSWCDYQFAPENDVRAVFEFPGFSTTPKFETSDYCLELAERWETRLSIPCHCFLFDARLFMDSGIRFDESLPNHEDWDCWMRVFFLKPEVRYIDRKLAAYRIHPGSMSRKMATMRRGFLLAVDRQKRRATGNPAMIEALRRKRREIRSMYREHTRVAALMSALRMLFFPTRIFLGSVARAVLPQSVVSWYRQARKDGG